MFLLLFSQRIGLGFMYSMTLWGRGENLTTQAMGNESEPVYSGDLYL